MSSRTSGRWTDKSELAEERRLAYVGITRARKRLHISRAIARTAWGSPQHNPPSRFLAEIPDRLFDWRRTGQCGDQLAEQVGDQRPIGAGGRGRLRGRPREGSAHTPRRRSWWAAGDRVLHTTFGMGTVVATSGAGDDAKADVDFGSAGLKRLSLRHAPLEKL